MQHKKGQMQVSSLQGFAIGIGILVLIVAIMAQLLGQVRTTQTAATVEYNTTTQGLVAIGQFSSWFGIIILVGIAVVIIYLLRRGLGGVGGA